jgi:hypothetical protein
MKKQKDWKEISKLYKGYEICDTEWLLSADKILEDDEFTLYVLMIH